METKQQQEFDRLLIESAKKHMDVFELAGFKRTFPSLYKTMLEATEKYSALDCKEKLLASDRLRAQEWHNLNERVVEPLHEEIKLLKSNPDEKTQMILELKQNYIEAEEVWTNTRLELHAEIKDLTNRLSTSKEKSEWISVDKELPEPMKEILMLNDNKPTVGRYHNSFGAKGFFNSESWYCTKVTHWMYLSALSL